jgi:23S rRNA pseudouridine2457 synthase
MQYLMFYKPYGVLTQFTDATGRPTLKDFISVPSVYPVGRLDRDSEGLLLLSDDGKLKARLLEPRFGHRRTYWVQVEGLPSASALETLRQGVIIQGQRTLPAQVEVLTSAPDLPPRNPPIRERRLIPTSWLELTLTEGRNRQVRRMTAAVGLPTLRLVRVTLGPLHLTGLDCGQWRFLTSEEVGRLRQECFPQPRRHRAAP